jgi:hypothetical protein
MNQFVPHILRCCVNRQSFNVGQLLKRTSFLFTVDSRLKFFYHHIETVTQNSRTLLWIAYLKKLTPLAGPTFGGKERI